MEANTFTQCRQREHGTGIMCNINRKIEIKKRTNGRREKSRTREKRHVWILLFFSIFCRCEFREESNIFFFVFGWFVYVYLCAVRALQFPFSCAVFTFCCVGAPYNFVTVYFVCFFRWFFEYVYIYVPFHPTTSTKHK